MLVWDYGKREWRDAPGQEVGFIHKDKTELTPDCALGSQFPNPPTSVVFKQRRVFFCTTHREWVYPT
jgi:hypothetical protein